MKRLRAALITGVLATISLAASPYERNFNRSEFQGAIARQHQDESRRPVQVQERNQDQNWNDRFHHDAVSFHDNNSRTTWHRNFRQQQDTGRNRAEFQQTNVHHNINDRFGNDNRDRNFRQ